ncbi:MAG: ATP-dependent Clp protease ATP-binding subunit [Egibacteraceae bacterium]
MPNGDLCQRCGVRSAVAQARQLRPGMPPLVGRLCQVCVQEVGQAARPGTFDEFFAQFFGGGQTPPPQPPGGGPQQVDITRFFSQATRQTLHQAAHQAVEWGSAELDSDHLLWAALSDQTVQLVLHGSGIDPQSVAREVEARTPKREPTNVAPALSPDAKRVLLAAFEESRQLGVDYIGPEHILLGLTRDSDSAGGQVLREAGVDGAQLQGPVARSAGGDGRAPAQPASQTPTLDQHSRDLTAAAANGVLDPVIGRDSEIEQTIEVLSRRTKNNPVLVGEAGVGKTAIVEGIAQRIVAEEVPETLQGKRLVELDIGGMVAGTRHRGDFEERIQKVVEEVTRHSEELILFIDELHTIVGAGSAEGSVDAANMLKPALARGTLHAIGATTLDEYRTSIERDPALERRFQPITVPAPSVEETIQILYGLKDRYEAFHRVRITDEAIVAAAELSDRYIADRFLPDKAIDLIDQGSARIRLRHHSKPPGTKALEDECRQLRRDKDQAVAAEDYERAGELRATLTAKEAELENAHQARHECADLTAEHIAEVVSRATGVPVSQLTEEERERLLGLEQRLHRRVVGQSEAIDAIAEAVRRSRAGLGDPGRPVGSFLFLGPTGVGKTETARALAETLFDDEDRLVRFDMSEFQERHTVSRLIGAPPGYVGYDEAGQLTEQVRRTPYCVLLLDEIEKAHPDVFNSLLAVLDDGRLTDAKGRTVDFTNTVVIMTSNLGSERITAQGQQPLGFSPAPAGDEFEQIKDDLRDVLRRELRPEFLNRIDEIVVFRPLSDDQLQDITRLLVNQVARRMTARGITLELTDEAVTKLSDDGHDPDFGARPLRRTIQRGVENVLSRMVLDGSVDDGDRVSVRCEDGQLAFDVKRGGADQPTTPVVSTV